jgi:prolyl 4-hydroxylase
MKLQCAPACLSCHYLSIEGRCPIDPDAPNAWSPGGLNDIFTKLTSEPYLSSHDVRILSSPENDGGPWVITMENIVSEEEAKVLIDLGAADGYQRSGEVGPLKPDGSHDKEVNPGRTSHNSWCNADTKCYQSEVTRRVLTRLTNMTGIPETNSESLQLLRYESGQFYRTHHD